MIVIKKIIKTIIPKFIIDIINNFLNKILDAHLTSSEIDFLKIILSKINIQREVIVEYKI